MNCVQYSVFASLYYNNHHYKIHSSKAGHEIVGKKKLNSKVIWSALIVRQEDRYRGEIFNGDDHEYYLCEK